MFINLWEKSTLWVLHTEQESYLPYIKGGKKDIENYIPISPINLDYKMYTANS